MLYKIQHAGVFQCHPYSKICIFYSSMLVSSSVVHIVKFAFSIQDSLCVESSAPQLLLLYRLLMSWYDIDPQPEVLHQDSLVDDALATKSKLLKAVISYENVKNCHLLMYYQHMLEV